MAARRDRTELYDIYVERVDGVDKPATRREFLLLKAEEPDELRASARDLANAAYETLLTLAEEDALALGESAIDALNKLADLVEFPSRFTGKRRHGDDEEEYGARRGKRRRDDEEDEEDMEKRRPADDEDKYGKPAGKRRHGDEDGYPKPRGRGKAGETDEDDENGEKKKRRHPDDEKYGYPEPRRRKRLIEALRDSHAALGRALRVFEAEDVDDEDEENNTQKSTPAGLIETLRAAAESATAGAVAAGTNGRA